MSENESSFDCDGGCGLAIQTGDRFLQMELRISRQEGSEFKKNEGRYCCSGCLLGWMQTHEQGPREHAAICTVAERVVPNDLPN